MNIPAIRREYSRMSLSEQTVDPDPYKQFHLWFRQALDLKLVDAEAMVLATVDGNGIPSSRMVLLRNHDPNGFVFFTNYHSRKGSEIRENKHVSLLFYWKELERQVRINGSASKITRKESAAYFHSRPLESRISAVISPQSKPVTDRKWLEDKWDEAHRIYQQEEPPLPDSWGGYRVKPVDFEFFQGRPHRLHDRICYRRQRHGWILERLAP